MSHSRELLNDSNFHSSLERVQQEPVPYFTQFSVPPHTTATSTSHTTLPGACTDHTSPSGRAHPDPESDGERSEAAEERTENEVSHERAVRSVRSPQGEASHVASGEGEESRSNDLNPSSNVTGRYYIHVYIHCIHTMHMFIVYTVITSVQT